MWSYNYPGIEYLLLQSLHLRFGSNETILSILILIILQQLLYQFHEIL